MAQRLASRVLLVGWDAADWQMIRPLLDAGDMPYVRRFVEGGVTGNIATLQPVISPILWNSIATGKRADKHGILGFVEPDGRGGLRPVSSTSRRAKAIWNILSQNGLRSCVVGWYASHPAEPIRGCIVTDRYEHTGGERAEKFPLDRDTVHPSSLLDKLSELRVRMNDITAQQVLPFVPEAQRIKQPEDIRLPALCHLLAECATLHNAATWLLENQEWDFAAVYYDGIDHFGHGFMEYNPPRMSHVSPQDFDIYRHVMQGAYRFHDMMLGRLLQIVGPDTAVLLVSDHGFFSNELRPALSRDPKDPRRKTGPGANPIAWHRQFGIFGALGPGIREDQLVHGASLLDIAPTVLALLGLPLPQDMDGKPLTQILTQPPQLDSIETYEAPHPDDGVQREEQPDDPESSRVVLKRLAELGYIESPQQDEPKIVERALADRRHNLAQVYFSSGRVPQALEILTELLKQGENPHLRCRIAMCHLALDQPELARQTLEPVIAQPFDHPLADMLYAEVLLKRGEYQQARELLEKTQAANPRLGHLHTHLGLVYLHERDWSRAEQAFRRALEIDGDNAEAHDHLGVALQRQGRFEDAVYHHMRSAALVHHRVLTHLHLGMALARLRRTDWAIRALNVAAELAPRLALPHRLLARLYRRQKNDRDAARNHLQIARKLRAAGPPRRRQAV